MNKHAALLHEYIENGDATNAAKLWAVVSPGLPPPSDPLAALHVARTAMGSMPMRKRAFSHQWLAERGLPSGLPDELRPRAQRMYPVKVGAVGISVNFSSKALAPLAHAVRTSMEDAVHEAHADGKKDDANFIRARMQEAREYTMKKLVGKGVS